VRLKIRFRRATHCKSPPWGAYYLSYEMKEEKLEIRKVNLRAKYVPECG